MNYALSGSEGVLVIGEMGWSLHKAARMQATLAQLPSAYAHIFSPELLGRSLRRATA